MNVIIFNNIRGRSFDFFDEPITHYPRRRFMLNSHYPPNNYQTSGVRIDAIRNIFEKVGRATEIPDIFNVFLIEMCSMRVFTSADDILRFLSFNIHDLVNRGILYAETTQGGRFWRSIYDLYMGEFNREMIHNEALRNTF